MLADEVDYVVGVDTHRDEHVLAVVVAPSGVVLSQQSVRASARGYAQAVRFIEQCTEGRRVWAVEGAGHYGAGLARYLSSHGETVLEIGRGRRDEQRLRGKEDSLDAIRAEPARFSVYRWVVRCCRGCGLRSGCVGLPSRASSCNRFASSFWRA
jgi:transposase